MANIMLIDNIDSFTYNFVEQLRIFKHHVCVYRNNIPTGFLIHNIKNSNIQVLIISAGPGLPKDAGCIIELIRISCGHIPIIGICLGHQAIIEFYGGKVCQSGEILHGKTSLIEHDNKAMFKNIGNPMLVARYHSLIGNDIPISLTVNAKYRNMVMAVRHNIDRICGFQFHPESILTPEGSLLIKQTINWVLEK
ncbi:glutamine amidotransferase-related protein [Pantoea sp. SoEX]|uniref:glutamine amidotransferase-related protein n=1 Tax=Pantoea sp. SoEX TaxID=2576763 RepID=UPI00135742D1|nr:gamma-glutamyl-gamma-aminobutyrate hydrolase family protein [Pantoea sp. SoEX]MXP50940.1 anthranilate synthase component II [Pantoea sp. SoEX]